MKDVTIEIVSIETGEVVHQLTTTSSRVDRVSAGMLINMDTDRYFLRERNEEVPS